MSRPGLVSSRLPGVVTRGGDAFDCKDEIAFVWHLLAIMLAGYIVACVRPQVFPFIQQVEHQENLFA